jgi:hypothetical protein
MLALADKPHNVYDRPVESMQLQILKEAPQKSLEVLLSKPTLLPQDLFGSLRYPWQFCEVPVLNSQWLPLVVLLS